MAVLELRSANYVRAGQDAFEKVIRLSGIKIVMKRFSDQAVTLTKDDQEAGKGAIGDQAVRVTISKSRAV